MTAITDAFSEAASFYDGHSDIQNHVFAHLAGFFPDKSCFSVLDIGSGTGMLTASLTQRYPEATVLGVDAAPHMVLWAQKHHRHGRIGFVCCTADAVQVAQPVDLIVSNATLQWVSHPEAVIGHLNTLLAESGLLVFSAFGPETYQELGTVMRQVWGRPVITSAGRFLDGESWRKLLVRHCSDVVVSQVHYRRTFDSLRALLRSIKYTGTRGLPEGPKQWTPGFFHEVERVYLAHYRQIIASYQVYYCQARRA